MNEINDGGPAFPSGETVTEMRADGSTYTYSAASGMTLRDYFASNALPALIDAQKFDRFDLTVGESRNIVDRAAFRAYAFADAMLRARGDA